MIGEKFGEWTVVKRVDNYKTNVNYECICSCGNKMTIRRTYLINKRTSKCRSCAGHEFKDLTGRRFGKTTIIGFGDKKDEHGNNVKYFLGKCDCGAIRHVYGNDLLRGQSHRCRHCRSITHGKSNTSIYRIYRQMLDRCYNPVNAAYRNYGARGIDVCDRWLHSFDNFYHDMGDRPLKMQLDRTDNEKGYSPDNCKWVAPAENHANRRISPKNRADYIIIKRDKLCVLCRDKS
jgi:hypothetical protein